MERGVGWLLAAFVLLVSSGGCGTGLEGLVTSFVTGKPISGAEVILDKEHCEWKSIGGLIPYKHCEYVDVADTTTGVDGTYYIDDPSTLSGVRLLIRKNGYQPHEAMIEIDNIGVTTHDVRLVPDPQGQVTLDKTCGSGGVELSWKYPQDTSVRGVLLVRHTGTFPEGGPVDPVHGRRYAAGESLGPDPVLYFGGDRRSYTDRTAKTGVEYRYRAFSYTAALVYSDAAFALVKCQ